MKSSATTVREYLASLPADRRAGIEAVRRVILKNLDRDYDECMLYGMIGYAVPHRVWPTGYHCDPKKPLLMAALSSQKSAMTVYLMSVYNDKAERAWFQNAWAKTGRKLNMGGCCVRFRKLEDAALEVVAEIEKSLQDYKRKILDSRVLGTALISQALADLPAPPQVLVSASAIGYYGDTGDSAADEDTPAGSDFLAEVCVALEAAAEPAREEQPAVDAATGASLPRLVAALDALSSTRAGVSVGSSRPSMKAYCRERPGEARSGSARSRWPVGVSASKGETPSSFDGPSG